MTDGKHENHELDELGARLGRPLRTMGANERLPAAFEARLLARVRAEMAADAPRARASDIPRGARRWLFQPRSVAMSPARALLIAAGLVLAAALGGRATSRGERAAAPAMAAVERVAPTADTVRLVQFVLVAPDARTVSLVGDFNDWAAEGTPLRTVGGNGVWSVEVPLPTGRYQYAFIVNGERWVVDPGAPRAVEESFGTPNSVITVGERSS